MLILANTFRSTGAVLFFIGALAILGYLLYNFVIGRKEVGSEVELAANKKPYLDDEQLETKKLDMSLTMGLGLLAVIGLGLPLYWLGEPGRQSGYSEFTTGQLTSRGEALYEELCSACHGPGAVGGVAPYTVTDTEGRFVASVQWKAPALTAALYRFSTEEIRYTLDYGRQNSPMPAWGAPGGGPLTSQQIEELILYIQEIQLAPDELAAEVEAGIEQAARFEVTAADPSLEGDDAINAAVEQYITSATPAELGQLVFDNPGSQGAYSCARCHTAGWSWDSDLVALDPEQPFGSLIPLQVSGGGGFGPNLTSGATTRQFLTTEDHAQFLRIGAQDGVAYGAFGQGDGGGQMPAFGSCVGERDTAEFSPFVGFCEIELDGIPENRGGMLTEEQIQAVVAYEREM